MIDVGGSAQFIRVIAAPPSVGATPVDIVQGFLVANASLESDHAIARRYLTPRAARRWDPGASTTVYDLDSLRVEDGPETSVTASATLEGVITPEGVFGAADPVHQSRVEFQLQLEIEGGAGVPQWRIRNPEPGILISDVDLGRAFREYQVFHPSARSDALVPEARYLPVAGPSLPTALAERVIDGPPPWLAPAVRRPAPEGTSLSIAAVPVDDGVAVVDLSGAVRSADERDRRDLAAQLTWTLLQVPGVRAVRLLTGGEPVQVPGAPDVMDRSVWQSRNPDTATIWRAGVERLAYYVLEGSSIVRVAGSDRTSWEPEEPALASMGQLAVALDQRTASVVTSDGRGLWTFPIGEGGAPVLLAGRDLSGASFDVDGGVWYTDRGRVLRVMPDGQPERVVVDRASVAGSVASIHQARDGARVVLVSGGALYLGVIRPVADGVEVTSVRRLANDVTDVRDVAWRDSTTLDVIGSHRDSGPRALRVSVGSGAAVALGSPPVGDEIAGAPGASTIVLGPDGRVLANLGLQWVDRGGADSVAYPG